MPQNLITSVRREIDRLQEEIKRRTAELASLRDDLKRHQRVYRLLGGGDRRVRRPTRQRRAARRVAPVNWDSVLQGLPNRFALADIAKARDAKGKSPVYVRHIAVRWAKQGKTKRVGRGTYQKVQQGKLRRKVPTQSKK